MPSPLGVDSKHNVRINVCPGELFIQHVHPEHSDKTPFLQIKSGHPYNVEMARSSLKKMELFDADTKIMVITAHDWTLLPFLNYLPHGVNGWHDANWKELSRWEFLKDFALSLEGKFRMLDEA